MKMELGNILGDWAALFKDALLTDNKEGARKGALKIAHPFLKPG